MRKLRRFSTDEDKTLALKMYSDGVPILKISQETGMSAGWVNHLVRCNGLQHRHMQTESERLNAFDVSESGCWEWSGNRNTQGYGVIIIGRKGRLAHRISFVRHGGVIVEGELVLHRCDNPPCINPEHLFSGTQFDNMGDSVSKGRFVTAKRISSYPRGERHGHAKLTEDLVREIRISYALGDASQSELGRMYDIKQSTIGAIVKRKTWDRVELTDAEKYAAPVDRIVRGEKQGRAKLTDDSIRIIRDSDGSTLESLARRFGVGISTVGRIRRGMTWRHVV